MVTLSCTRTLFLSAALFLLYFTTTTGFHFLPVSPSRMSATSMQQQNQQQDQQATAIVPTPSNPWYSDASIGRDRNQVLIQREADWNAICGDPKARFVLQTTKGMYYSDSSTSSSSSSSSVPKALFWTYSQLVQLLGEETLQESLHSTGSTGFLAWLGEHEEHNYWVCYVANDPPFSQEQISQVWETLNDSSDGLHINGNSQKQQQQQPQIAGLREFGDRLESSVDSAILATANGIVEFHRSHPFCSKCGSPTRIRKAGGSRQCTNQDTCGVPVYPRIDVASIMLITSRCEMYALLGRKSFWPQGRYSTLAGFAEVGETLEQCCARETFEESGVIVDPSSMRFVCSQPWPFPRSLMVGFRAKARDSDRPTIQIEEVEMEDIQWFHKDYVRDRLEGGSTAMSFAPNEREQEFHIPGPSSLARILISQWANE